MQISDRSKQLVRIVTFAVIGGLLLYFLFSSVSEGSYLSRIFSALLPFMIGAFIAFILKPICNKLDILFGDLFVNKFRRRRIESGKTTEKRVRRQVEIMDIFIAWILLLAVLTGIMFLVIPSLWNSIAMLADQFGEGSEMRNLLDKVQAWFETLNGSENIIFQWIYDTYISITGGFSGEGGNILSDLFSGFDFGEVITRAGSIVAAVADVLVGILVTVISSVYILANRKRFALQATMFAHALFRKNAAEWVVNEVKFANRKFSEFFTGKLLDSFIVGCLLFIMFSIFGINQAPLLAVFMAFCNMIPFFGPFIGAIPCAFIVLMANISDPIRVVYFLAIVLIIQQLDGNILDPFIVGDSIGISSFWVLFAVILFGDLFGFLGMLLGVPIFAVIYDIVRQLINFGLKKRGEEQLMTNYNFIFHDPNEERDARKKRAAAIKAARKEARRKEEAEREEALAREVAIAAAAAAARAEAEAKALAETEEAATAAEEEVPMAEETAPEAEDVPDNGNNSNNE